MKTITGDIWTLATSVDAVVVATNVGWKKETGIGIMGRGLALQAAQRFGWLKKAWGEHCQAEREMTGPVYWRVNSKWCRYLICAPTKALCEKEPWRSWQFDSTIEFIVRQLPGLASIADATEAYAKRVAEPVPLIYVPSLGCANGGLEEDVVLPVMQKYLVHPSFIHVRYADGK